MSRRPLLVRAGLVADVRPLYRDAAMNQVQPAPGPLAPDRATELVRCIVRNGAVAFGDRALSSLRSQGLTTADCHNVLRWGTSDPASSHDGAWYYRLHTANAFVVVAFRSDLEIVVMSAGKKK